MDTKIRHGFVKAGVAIPLLKVANPFYNAERILELMAQADEEKLSVVVFPELCLTGYTCGDLFDQRFLRNRTLDALAYILQKTINNQVIAVLGLPIESQEGLYNCAILIQKGNILGVVPKMYLPDFAEYQESRWFLSGLEISKAQHHISLLGRHIPFGHLIFESPTYSLGVELCEDMWLPIAPGIPLALQGANLLVNPMAGNEGGSKAENRKKMVQRQSSRCQSAYLLASAGIGESTTDLVFGGHAIIGENGYLLNDGATSRFKRSNTLITAELDIESIIQIRLRNKSFARQKGLTLHGETYLRIPVIDRSDGPWLGLDFNRNISQKPFEPEEPQALATFCKEVIEIQKAALARRIDSIDSPYIVMSIDCDLNSALALIIAIETLTLLDLPTSSALAVYMPGINSNQDNQELTKKLVECLGATFQSIPITDSDYALNQKNSLDKNLLSRLRTFNLLNITNQNKGLLLGTVNMSDTTLGLTTFGGDMTAMYNINVGLPISVIQQVVNWAVNNYYQGNTAKILQTVLKIPCSMELIAPNNLGPYYIHDFFLYYTLKFGTTPDKLLFLAEQAFGGKYDSTSIKQWLDLFYIKFFAGQYKRSVSADGAKTLGLSLSPRIGLRLPSDIDGNAWWN